MRKHDVRKWLHAVLDLLPVILIPVFMIYSHRHTIDSGSIQVPQNEVVDFNQQAKQLTNDNWRFINVTGTIENNIATTISLISPYSNNGLTSEINLDIGSKVLFSCELKRDVESEVRVKIGGRYGCNTYFSISDTFTVYQTIQTINSQYDNVYQIGYYSTSNTLGQFEIKNIQCFNLTQMFGSGNEPTLEQFNEWYSNDYYDYTLSRKELIKDVSTITYNDTDIMSQVVYQLYNSVDKYFNMGNVFNMTGVYDWFNLNIFNGNAPISIYIVWNIVLYEFVMDLLFLLYGLFMWFIDMVEKLMEKPLKSVK